MSCRFSTRGHGRGRGMSNNHHNGNQALPEVVNNLSGGAGRSQASRVSADHRNQNKRGSQSMMNLCTGDNEQFTRNSQRQSHRGPRRGNHHNEVSQQPMQSQSYGNEFHRQPWGRDQHNQGPHPPYHPSHNQGQSPPYHPSHNQGQSPPYHPSHNQGQSPPYHPSHNQGQSPPYHPSHNQGPHPPYHPSHNQGPHPPYHPSHNQGQSPPYNQSSRNSRNASQDWRMGPSENKKQTSSENRNPNCQDYQAFQHGPSCFNEQWYDHSGNDRREQYNQTPPPSYDEAVRQYDRIIPSAPPLMDLKRDSDQYFENYSQKTNSFKDQTAGNGPGRKNNPLMQGNPKKSLSSRLNPEELAKILSSFDGHLTTAEVLSRQVQRNEEEVIKLVESHKDIFSCKNVEAETQVELVPRVSLCSQYLSPEGCVYRDGCHNIHICKFYINGFCEAGVSCQYGHRWDTDHNSSIISKLYLNLVDKLNLYYVIQKVCKKNLTPEICNFYNTKKGCTRNEKCSRLHICKGYVRTGGNCSYPKCLFSHDISTGHCKRLFKRYGISTNETKRDILLTLSQSIHEQDVNRSSSVSLGKEKTIMSNDSNCKNDDSDSDCSEKSDTLKRKGQRKHRKKKPDVEGKKTEIRNISVQSTDVCGDVQVPEMCIYAVEGTCRNAIKGCRYLHARSLFHWQFQKGSKWYNFRIFQSKALETAYRDVSKDNFRIPPFDPSKAGSCAKELMKIFGTGSWEADFKDMSCKVSSESKQLKIRRISTRSAGESKSPNSTVYDWYFYDEQGKWIRYGQVDSLGNEHLVCSTTCEDIEKQFLTDHSSSMVIRNSTFQYCLNFAQMTQTNLKTNMVREIRRRPSQDTYQRKTSPDSNQNSLPSHWHAMTASQTHILVTLDPTTNEYQKVTGLLRLTLPTASVQNIQRLQNTYLWQQLKNKKDFLSRSYDETQLNMQKLFYGTDSSKIDTICKESIDWRHGTTASQEYGKGNYFSNSAAVARRHCSPNAYGRYSLILAEVIIGTVVKGSPTLTRPPVNPNTNTLYDTTVDNVNAPTVFVKYDKEEYYPEYVIEFL